MCVCLSVSLSVWLPICIFGCHSVCLLACLSVCQSVSLSVCQSVSLWVCQSVSLWVSESVSLWVCESVSLWVCESVSESVRQSVSPSVRQSVSPSVHQSVSLSVCQSVSLSACQSVSLWNSWIYVVFAFIGQSAVWQHNLVIAINYFLLRFIYIGDEKQCCWQMQQALIALAPWATRQPIRSIQRHHNKNRLINGM